MWVRDRQFDGVFNGHQPFVRRDHCQQRPEQRGLSAAGATRDEYALTVNGHLLQPRRLGVGEGSYLHQFGQAQLARPGHPQRQGHSVG